MFKKYTVEEFISNHKHINYCEAVIDSDGFVIYVEPSHIQTMIALTGESREVIDEKMPIEASPIEWLTNYTNCIAVWHEGFIKPHSLTKMQKDSLDRLIEAGCVRMKNFRSKDLSEEVIDALAEMNSLLSGDDKKLLRCILEETKNAQSEEIQKLLEKLK